MKAKTTSEPGAREPFWEIAQEGIEWHWCLWSGNGRPLARNAEPYGSKKDCIQAIKAIAPNASVARLVAQNHVDGEDQAG